MSPSDLDALKSKLDALKDRVEWTRQLSELIAAARDARATAAGDGVEAATREALEVFRDYPCPFDDLVSVAIDAVRELALTDINAALDGLDKLQIEIASIEGSDAWFTTPELAPRRNLVRAFSALTVLHKHHEQQPFAHKAIGKQLGIMLKTVGALLDSVPIVAAKASPRRTSSPSKRKARKK